ncbi:MAG TPA: ATP-binding cassette domain-containing protein [Chthoniobacterales bacterium]|jgi:simple sugar transport system ATP-binding protein|nr:ATP-binding cassette domain-containing protein [Chthoniobacterales bacterium]
MEQEKHPLLSVHDITKYFGGIRALDKVNLDVYEGEVVALLGDNGAGKSTLIKILAGAYQPDEGEIRLDGKTMLFRTPRDAMEGGIHTVFQELSLCDNLDVAANLFLGSELEKRFFNLVPWFDHFRMRQEATTLLHDLAVDIPRVDRRVRELSGGQRQALAISKAVREKSRLLIMDEPTAALGVAQTRKVLDLVHGLKTRNLAIIYISHNLHDILEVSDRCVVLKNGRKVAEITTREFDKEKLTSVILTGELTEARPNQSTA